MSADDTIPSLKPSEAKRIAHQKGWKRTLMLAPTVGGPVEFFLDVMDKTYLEKIIQGPMSICALRKNPHWCLLYNGKGVSQGLAVNVRTTDGEVIAGNMIFMRLKVAVPFKRGVIGLDPRSIVDITDEDVKYMTKWIDGCTRPADAK